MIPGLPHKGQIDGLFGLFLIPSHNTSTFGTPPVSQTHVYQDMATNPPPPRHSPPSPPPHPSGPPPPPSRGGGRRGEPPLPGALPPPSPRANSPPPARGGWGRGGWQGESWLTWFLIVTLPHRTGWRNTLYIHCATTDFRPPPTPPWVGRFGSPQWDRRTRNPTGMVYNPYLSYTLGSPPFSPQSTIPPSPQHKHNHKLPQYLTNSP
ncbi:hypothetical protein G9A89_000342 [Geosiphon pyriformis]|nr:hypothetical protein G9A89_000342 [Geosiphon pyriformis]